MTQITLIRHGQANTHARDEDDYDRLSELGHQQAKWLGDHFRATGQSAPRLFSGTMRRQRETAQGLLAEADLIEDARLNELPYYDLAHLFADQHQIAHPKDREEFITYMPQLMEAWQRDEIADAPESFASFQKRVEEVLNEIAIQGAPAIVVTSGGLISMAMKLAMDMSTRSMARIAPAVMNSSVHRLEIMGPSLAPVLFNAVPHLDQPDRHYARTFI